MAINTPSLALLAAVLLSGTVAAVPPPAGTGGLQGADVPAADHHMHIFSPESARVLKILCDKLGPTHCPPASNPSTAEDALRELDAAGIRNGVLLSTGYFFGSPELAEQGLDVAQETRAENTFVVEQARSQCGRLVAFIGVDPLAPNALDEIAYWGSKGGATGVKLHLGSSSVDFRSPEQVRKLAAVFAAAAKARFPIVIHMETRAKAFGAADAAIFLRDVLPSAGKVPVQIAHAAGGGGVDSHSLAALGTFADAFEHEPAATAHLYFDLAMVPGLAIYVKATPEDVTALKKLMRKIGLRRFLLASDWQTGLDLKTYYATEKALLALPAADWRTLASNTAPYIPRKSNTAACAH